MKPLTLTVNDTSVALGLGRTKIYQLLASRGLTGIKVGRRRLITVESIQNLVETAATDNRPENVR